MVDTNGTTLPEGAPRWGRVPDEEIGEPLSPREIRRSARGWWVGRWMRSLSLMFDATRLAAGRALAQEGRVLSMEAQLGLVTARVQAEAPEAMPYRVHLSFAPLSDAQWDRVIVLLGERAIYAAQLMNGELPEEIETVFRASGVSLFPANLQELGVECTCSDWAISCKHRAAVCYLLGAWFDRDPFLLLTLRGRTRDQIAAALRTLRASQAGGAGAKVHERAGSVNGSDVHSLPTDPERFWGLDAELISMEIAIAPPEVERELLQILGELSPLQDADTRLKLEAVYRQVSRQAIEAAQRAEPGALPPSAAEPD